MNRYMRPDSPEWTPRPLQPSPWNTPRISPVAVSPTQKIPEVHPLPPLYSLTRPVEDPCALIHSFYNVVPVPFSFDNDGSVPRSVEMPLVRRGGNAPTHALAVLSSSVPFPSVDDTTTRSPHDSRPSSPASLLSPVDAEPFLLPIDASLFCACFGHSLARSLAAGLSIRPATPLVRWDRARGQELVTLPLVALYVPHPPSIPHFLLFAQSIPVSLSPPASRAPSPAPSSPSSLSLSPLPSPVTSPSSRLAPLPARTPSPSPSLASASTSSRPSSRASTRSRSRTPARPHARMLVPYMLPPVALAEFPSAPAMAEAMARHTPPPTLRAHVAWNHGLWRNVLALAPTDPAAADGVRLAWNVTADARRLAFPAECRPRERSPSPCPPSLSPSPSPSRSRSPLPSPRAQTVTEPGPRAGAEVRSRTPRVSVHAPAGEAGAAGRTSAVSETTYLAPPRELSRQRSREIIRQRSREMLAPPGHAHGHGHGLVRQRSARDLLTA
ncbi:uncharacterized protein BXZ73DRAFT_103347 [Epithele typhae]|uniref:uncharacterized protein n=1 Tax=Epithele typhae TaxID=378194 RepID=UPI002007B8C9|nr:uncharacterized protein BXZ73DRAFT_103347 [Epithele typhae]KAH9924970.1 hypothetical protein BXZ73DRAFT_103347 [Epithele typhae]